jgi:predicted phage-related endonuclease
MEILNVQQGSPEWLAHRAQHFNASDAPAMMGCSPYETRAELLRRMHTGVAADIDAGTQRRFDAGHRLEALARPLAEEFVGTELYPVVGSEGRLSASFDGLTLDESIGFEHKHLNADLRACMPRGDGEVIGNAFLPLNHRVQMEQQLLISGAERVLFMASSWDADGGLVEERHCWYVPDLVLRQQIVDGWEQFRRDLAAYVLPDSSEPAAPVGKAPETLPALRIEVKGEVTASNLLDFKTTALAAIRSVNRELRTDQDFADAEKAVKWCADVESRLTAAKNHALSQTSSIDALFKAIDDISAEARRVRLDLDKLVTRRKTEVKEDAVVAARRALALHIEALNAELVGGRLPPSTVDFAGAIKGLRSVRSMQDALDSALAGGKIAADAAARGIRANMATFQAVAAGFEFLFADVAQLVHKPADDFKAAVQARIATHRAAEAEREQQRKAAEDARVQAEAQRLAAQQAEDARVAALAEQRRQDAAAEAVRVAASAAPVPAPAVVAAQPPAVTPIAPIVSRAAVPVPRANEPATLNIGAICARLDADAGLKVSAAFLADRLHIRPAKIEGASRLYSETQFQLICRQLISHVGAMGELYAGEPA